MRTTTDLCITLAILAFVGALAVGLVWAGPMG